MIKKERLKEAVKLMLENSEKYFELVWYARANTKKLMESECYEGLKAIQDIERKYPKEVMDFREDDNWSHGFNSGMLAASRLYLEMIEGDVNIAIDSFPFLDT